MTSISADPVSGATAYPEDGHPLDNPVWHALTSHHAGLAEVAGPARRYPRDIAVFAAAERLDAEGWAGLARLAGPGEAVVLTRPSLPPPPPGWRVTLDIWGHQMVATDLVAEEPAPPGVTVRPLGADDTEAVLALVKLTAPGPFEASTITMGRYVGIEEGGRLVAMAGERLHLPGYTEVSAVCTHPDARGRGLAAVVTHAVARGIRSRGETPILHVASYNDAARRLYLRLGFMIRTRAGFMALEPPATHMPG